MITKELKLDEMTPNRHWLGFDYYTWSANWPIYSIVPSYTKTETAYHNWLAIDREIRSA